MSELEDTERTLDASQLRPEGADDQQLTFVVLGETGVDRFPLPKTGEVRVGRGEEVGILIDHALISREHAILRVRGASVELEDLGSRNGSFVRGQRLEPGAIETVAPGQMIQFGEVTCVLQRSGPGRRLRRLATHGYLEARLEERCESAQPARDRFAVARLRLPERISYAKARAALGRLTGPGDLAAAFAPGDYEVMLEPADASRLDRFAAALDASFDEPIRLGFGVYPADGRTADALLAAAGEALSQPGRREPQGPVVLDPAMRDLYQVAERVARGTISVLLLGETGAGKEVLAEHIHRSSPRRDQPFVRLNCAALTESLLESELFGYEKGAFTGAVTAKMGLLESANGGTVMLDELGEMPLSTQAKLLRVLEQRQVTRVGGLEPRPIDVRFVSATNRNLEQAVAEGTFRQDVFFRLNGVTLNLPPLRDRPEELEVLARRFIERTAADLGVPPPTLTSRALELCQGYAWPGNIRELRNTMERAVLLCTGDVIEPEHLPSDKMTLPWEDDLGAAPGPAEASVDLDDPEEAERRRILDALDACAGNQTRAAKMLGIGRRTLTSKLTKFGIRRPRKRA